MVYLLRIKREEQAIAVMIVFQLCEIQILSQRRMNSCVVSLHLKVYFIFSPVPVAICPHHQSLFLFVYFCNFMVIVMLVILPIVACSKTSGKS